jgi:hypothetical protein
MYSEQDLASQPLVDSDHWKQLEVELGFEMLKQFAQEFFDETQEIWMKPAVEFLSIDEKVFKSMAHRSAGASGTIGFQKLRFVFLCMEHNAFGEQTQHFLAIMQDVFHSTQQWLHAKESR